MTSAPGRPLKPVPPSNDAHVEVAATNVCHPGLTVHCEVTATTPHGVSAAADVGPIEVSSGCEEWYADVLQSGTIDAHIGGPERWLYATDPDQLFDYDEFAGPQL